MTDATAEFPKIFALFLGGIFALGGCSDTPSEAPRLLASTFSAALSEPKHVSREDAESVPFASIGVQIGNGNQGLLILGTSRYGELDWYSSNNVMIATRDGRIIETVGLPKNITRVNKLSETSPTTSANEQPDTNRPYNLLLDIQDLGIFGISATCEAKNEGRETIVILGGEIPTERIEENCHIAGLEWSFSNIFWRDPASGFVWRSTQEISPQMKPVTYEVLRPPSPGQ